MDPKHRNCKAILSFLFPDDLHSHPLLAQWSLQGRSHILWNQTLLVTYTSRECQQKRIEIRKWQIKRARREHGKFPEEGTIQKTIKDRKFAANFFF